jgi:hypothetical protein
MAGPPNNPFKLPFFTLCMAGGVVSIVVGAAPGIWWLVLGGAGLAVVSAGCVHVVRSGRDPWWLRSPLDARWRQPPQ